MAETKITLTAAALLFCLCLNAQDVNPDIAWRRFAMDGHRTSSAVADNGKGLTGTAAKEYDIIRDCAPEMAYLKEVVGKAPQPMRKFRPQSPLSNWFADLMLVQGEKFSGEKCDVAINNFGGIRSEFAAGDITVEDIRGMFPFKNDMVICKIRGSKLKAIFDEMARTKCEVLGGVQIVADRQSVLKVDIGGKPLEEDRIYNVVSNSFLLDGGDLLYLRRDSESILDTGHDFYETVLDYVRTTFAQNKMVEGAIDDRIIYSDRKWTKHAPRQSSAVKPYKPLNHPCRLTILHTNDTHSQIEPIRSGEDAGMGGVVERAAFVDSVRRANGASNVLLVDAGDFSQGTPYFTLFKGKVEVDVMNSMKYDIATIGNHEWDNGVEQLDSRLKKAEFKAVLCNYKIDSKSLSSKIKPYAIVRRGGLKIGLVGVLTDVSSAVSAEMTRNIHYIDPVEPVNKWAGFLKNEKKCDYIIVISHCGYSSKIGEPVGDVQMAPSLHNVDIIIGGHTHTNLLEPTWVKDADGKPIMIVTDYHKGVYVGEIKL